MWTKKVPTEPGLYLVYIHTEKDGWGLSKDRIITIKAEYYNDLQQGYHNELMFYPQFLDKPSCYPVYSREALEAYECLFSEFEIPKED